MEDNYRVAFGSLDDFVFMLSATPWTLPGFSLQRDIGGLLSMEESAALGTD
jgi:hypothetical protein